MAENGQDVKQPTEQELAELEPDDGIFMIPLTDEDRATLEAMGLPVPPAPVKRPSVDGRSGPAVDKTGTA